MHLNNISTGGATPNKPLPLKPSGGLEAKLGPAGERVGLDMSEAQKEDYIKDFSKRFPSLSGIEMVEREISVGSGLGTGSGSEIGVGPNISDLASGGMMKGGLRTKDV
jgi:AP2-associated kinase